jgi:CRISPR-associated protein Cas5t
MLGVYVTVPIACFRRGLAREYLETESLPPPATCYGFLLSLVGEERRARHIGCRVAPCLLNEPDRSVVLRTVWRVKSLPLGGPGNLRPDYQQLLSPVRLVIWLDSTEEVEDRPKLEERVTTALDDPASVDRYGGLSLGESTHLVNDVCRFPRPGGGAAEAVKEGRTFLLDSKGRMTLPVWVDHVGSAGTRYATGTLTVGPVAAPARERMPQIAP